MVLIEKPTEMPGGAGSRDRSSSAPLESWGRYPRVEQTSVAINAANAGDVLSAVAGPVLPYGQGRSYGDSCLNEGGTLLETSAMRSLLAFDRETGVLKCEAGVTLAQVLDFVVPRGWFLPTTPGTKFVSIGGAIANDVHGKNHHVAGTFGRHILSFELLRSDGRRYLCSPQQNADLYRATIGGLGLTGLIIWAELRLRPVSGPFIDMESVRFESLDEYLDIASDANSRYEGTMAWVDCLASGKQIGRGLLMLGNHAWQPHIPGRSAAPKRKPGIPLDFPAFALNRLSMRAFNVLHYHAQLPKRVRKTVPYDDFFYPLDSISHWNHMYGRRGFLQHQCVIPPEASREALRAIFEATSRAGEGSFLAVLKTFGDLPSPGMMSFPRPGATLALDFPMKGTETLRFLDRLDAIVMEHGGAVYPAKDARMSPATFEASFPRWREFEQHVDPRFSSSFWRRVTGKARQDV